MKDTALCPEIVVGTVRCYEWSFVVFRMSKTSSSFLVKNLTGKPAAWWDVVAFSLSRDILYRSSVYGSEGSREKAKLIILCRDV
jgi:hypothetical protein